MKYKVKHACHYINKPFPSDYFGENVTIESEDKGVFVFIPFTDTRFFEPIKTRTFQVEVNEEYVKDFKFLLQLEHDARWTGIEITEQSWINQYYKSGSHNAHLFSTDELSTIDIEEFKDDYQYGNKLQGVKWVKGRFGKGLKESKDLADFIFALSV